VLRWITYLRDHGPRKLGWSTEYPPAHQGAWRE
jgi:hypothetical protein